MLLPLLVVPLWLGYMLARRACREADVRAAWALAPGLGLSAVLALVAYLFKVMPLPMATLVAIGICAVGCLALLALPAPPAESLPVSPRRWKLVALFTLGAGVYPYFQQGLCLDMDNWVHAPLVSLMVKGNYPPRHPFFPDLLLHGHYGRDLLLAAAATLGADPTSLSWIGAEILQMVMVPVAFCLFRTLFRNELQALMGTAFMFFSINVGMRAGLADTFENNNPVVHLLLLTLLFMCIRAAQEPLPGRLLVAGLALGVYPLVYETHYGLLVLTLVGIGVVCSVMKTSRFAMLVPLVVIGLSVPVAATIGGQITYQAASALHHSPDAMEPSGEASQKVAVTFPKRDLFQVYMMPGYLNRVSLAWWVIAPRLDAVRSHNDDQGYVPIWSFQFLKFCWLPLYLAPLNLLVLWRRRCLPGLALWLFGAIAFLIPPLVNFGPLFESEYLRWFFASGVAFAAVLGVTTAMAMERLATHPRPHLVRLGIGLFVCLNLLGTGRNVDLVARRTWSQAQSFQSQTIGGGRWWDPDPRRLMMMGTLDCVRAGSSHGLFAPADVDAASWLWQRTGPGATSLRNFEDNWWSLFGDSYVGALAGTYMLGHDLGSHVDRPTGMSLQAQQFWATGNVAILQQMGVQWLYVDANRLSPEMLGKLHGDPHLHLGTDVTDGLGQHRLIFQVL